MLMAKIDTYRSFIFANSDNGRWVLAETAVKAMHRVQIVRIASSTKHLIYESEQQDYKESQYQYIPWRGKHCDDDEATCWGLRACA